MMSGSKGILPPDTYGLLRTLCSHNPKNMRNPHYLGYFLMFCGSQSHAFSCKHETHDLLTLVSYNYFLWTFFLTCTTTGTFFLINMCVEILNYDCITRTYFYTQTTCNASGITRLHSYRSFIR